MMHVVPQLLLGKVSYSESVWYSCRAIKRLPGRVVSCIYIELRSFVHKHYMTTYTMLMDYQSLIVSHVNTSGHPGSEYPSCCESGTPVQSAHTTSMIHCGTDLAALLATAVTTLPNHGFTDT